MEDDLIKSKFMRRKLLCKSLAGNVVDLITITAPVEDPSDLSFRPVVILTARVHPGETVASWMMRGMG